MQSKTIRLRKRLVRIHSPRRLRMSLKYLKHELAKSGNAAPENVKISPELNSYLMKSDARRLNSIRLAVEKSVDKNIIKISADLAPELKPGAKEAQAKNAEGKEAALGTGKAATKAAMALTPEKKAKATNAEA